MPHVHERDCALFGLPGSGSFYRTCPCGWPQTPCPLLAEEQRDHDEYSDEMSIGGMPYGTEDR